MTLRVTTLLTLVLASSIWTRGADHQLFIIERTTNGNIVHYDAHLDSNGHLDPREPIVAYWTIGSYTGRRQGLSFLEKTRAYGFRVRQTSAGRYVMTVVSQMKVEIEVYEDGGAIRAVTTIGGHRAFLQKIFANITSGFLLPKVNYVELFGTDVATGINCYQKILPD